MKQIIFLLVSIFLSATVLSQTNGSQFNLPQIIQNAPEAAALGRYGEIPVAINTGVPNISIPLYTITSGKLSLPVSISYHASGIKVSDQATSVGLGWALNAGGSITRVVQGIEDDNETGGVGFYNLILPDPNDPSIGAMEKCLSANICNNFPGLNPWDGQPDLFYYNFGGKSGKFIFKNRKAPGIEPGFITIPFSPIRITNQGGLNNFNVTDIDGTTYYFGGVYDTSQTTTNSNYKPGIHTTWHLTKILSADQSDSITFKYGISTQTSVTVNPRSLIQTFSSTDNTQWVFSNSPYSISTTLVNQSQLTEIDFIDGKVTFDYSSGQDASSTTRLDAMHIYNLQANAYVEIKRFNLFHSCFTSPSDNDLSTLYALRLDSLKETGLAGSPVSSQPPYVFAYYTSGFYQSPPYMSKGQDFWGYFNGKTTNQDLLFVSAPVMAQSSVGIASAAYKRIPDSGLMKVGTIQSIQYPTGGNSVFLFEPNQIPYTHNVSDTTFTNLGAYVTTFDMTPGNNSSTTTQFTVSNNLLPIYQSNGQPANAKLDFTGSPVCTSGCVTDQPIVKLDDVTAGVNVVTIELSQLNNANPPPIVEQIAYFQLITGHTYNLYFPSPGSLTGSQTFRNLYNRLDATLSGQSIANITSHSQTDNVYTGGLRIKQIMSTPQIGIPLTKEYKYTQAYFNSNLFDGSYNDLALNSYQFDGWNMTNGTGHCTTWGLSTRNYSENICLPLGSISNNSVSYSQVEEYQSDGQGGYNGKTVYNYNTALDIITMGEPFYKIDEEDQRGLLHEKQVYKLVNGNYMLVQDVVNTYEDLDAHLGTPPDTVVFYTAHGLVDNSVTKPNGPANPPNGGEGFGCFWCNIFDAQTIFQTNKWYYTSPRMVLQSSVSTTYDDNGNGVSVTQSYDYQNPLHIFPTHEHTLSSMGENLDTYSKYVLDYPNSNCTNSAMSNFQQRLNALKATYFPQFGTLYTKFINNDVQTAYPNCSPLNIDSVLDADNAYNAALTNYNNAVASLVTNYNTDTTNSIACIASYYNAADSDQQAIMDLQALNNISPVLQKTEFNNSTLVSTTQTFYKTFQPYVTLPSRVMFSTLSNPVESRLQYLSYDAHSRIKEAKKTGGMPVSYLWDYNDQYVTAEVKNADSSSIAYTSFEADGTGGWTVSGSGKVTSPSVSGNQYYNLGTGAISKTGLNSAQTYIVSYWTSNRVSYGFGGTVVQGKTFSINGLNWTYFEHTITGISTLTITGLNYIDELRLYPQGAQMTTYIYSPGVGMTSQCDVDSRFTYYNYDALGRLNVIKDQDGNIVKTIQYHYKGQ
jgi:YD repeat-containing protein